MSKVYFDRFSINREPGWGALWLVLGIIFEVCWVFPYVGWMIGLTGGVFFIFFGKARRRRKLFERFLQYGEVVGMRYRVPMAELAQLRRGDVNAARDDIRRIISLGYFGEGACIDACEDCLILPVQCAGVDEKSE